MTSENSDNFTSSFPIWLLLFHFSYMISMAMTFNTMLNRSGKSGPCVFFLILNETLSAFHEWYYVGCRFIIKSFYYVKICSLDGKRFPGSSIIMNMLANTGDSGYVSSISGSGKILWSKKWQPVLLFLLGKSHGQRSLRV